MEQLKAFIKKIGLSKNLECLVYSPTLRSFVLHTFKKNKQEITHVGDKRFNNIESATKYFENNKSSAPIILCISPLQGFEIDLTQELSDESKIEHIKSLYPNIDLEAHVIQYFKNSEFQKFNISNQVNFEQLLLLIDTLKKRLISINCFPFPLIQLLNLTQPDIDQINTNAFELKKKQDNSWEVSNMDTSDERLDKVHVFNSHINENELFPYSVAINYFEQLFQNYVISPKKLYEKSNLTIQYLFQWKHFVKKFTIFSLPALLTILLINNLIISNYNKKIESIQNVKVTTAGLRKSNTELKDQLSSMGVDYKNIDDYLGFTQFSMIVDELSSSIPKENIKLRTLSIAKPNEKKKSAGETILILNSNQIEVTGISKNVVTYSQWIDDLKKSPLLTKVENIEYEEDYETLDAYFKLHLHLKKSP